MRNKGTLPVSFQGTIASKHIFNWMMIGKKHGKLLLGNKETFGLIYGEQRNIEPSGRASIMIEIDWLVVLWYV